MKNRRSFYKLMALLLILVVFNVSMMPAPVAASEEENIDSFDVHPENRWSITNAGFTHASVNYGNFYLQDTGDGSYDTYTMIRGLRARSGKIEIRFMLNANATGSNADFFGISLRSSSNSTYHSSIYFQSGDEGGSWDAYFSYHDADGVYRTVGCTDLDDESWYRLAITYDIERTEINYKMYENDGSKLFDYDESDIFLIRPYFPAIVDPEIRFYSQCYTNYYKMRVWLDYIKAPFKEREWVQYDTPTDSDWLEDRWDLAHVQDDMADTSSWQLVVPYLDTVSGKMSCWWTNESGVVTNDKAGLWFEVGAVDADDGEIHSLIHIRLYQAMYGASDYRTYLYIYEGGILLLSNYTVGTSGFKKSAISFSISLSNNRSNASMKARFLYDIDTGDYYDYVSEIDVADVADNPSMEFVLRTGFTPTFQGDSDWIALFEDLGFNERDIFEGFMNGIIEPVGNFLSQVFTAAFRFLANIFKFVGDLIIAALLALQTALATILTTISSTLTSMGVDIGSILSNVGNLATDIAAYVSTFAGDIADAIWIGIGDALDFITDAIEAIWATLEDSIADIISWIAAAASDVADLVFAVIEYLIDLLLGIAIDLYGLIAEIVFAAWDALGLPNLLLWLDYLLTGIVQLANDGLDAVTWFVEVLAWWDEGVFFIGFILLFFIPVIMSKDVGEFAGNFVQMNSWSIIPLWLRVPVGVVYWPLLFLYVFQWG